MLFAMDGTTPYILAFAAFTITLLLLLRRDPLRSVPGPLLARWTPLWMVHHSRKGDMHTKMIFLHNKYGNIVRTGPNELSVSDPEAVKTIYGAGNKFRKSEWYSVWQGHRKFDLFAERHEAVHRTQRRLVSNAYSMDALKKLEPYVDQTLNVLLSKLSEFAIDGKGRTIDMALWAQLFAFDVIGEVTFSRRFGFLDAGQDDGSFAQIDIALKSASWIGQIPWLFWAHDRLSPVIGNWLGVAARHGSLRTFAAREIEARKDRGSDHRDMLEFLTQIHREKPEEMNEMGVLSMATSNVFAGSDTTAISISAVLYYLCRFPECKEKVMEEIAGVRKGSEVGSIVSLAEANRMPYLQACINEALRLHPAVGMSLPRVVPAGGMEVNGHYVPAGTVIGTNPWVIHRNRDLFGTDADTFRPERWLEDNKGQLQRFNFTFGDGSRVCIGKNLSLIEISKLVPTLLLHLDIHLADPEAEVKQSCKWFVKQSRLLMSLKPRTVGP